MALALGKEDPDAMLERMTYQCYLRWMEYFAAEPWGEYRADIRNAVLVMWIQALATGSGDDLPSLVYPYFEDDSPEAVATRARETLDYIQANRKELEERTCGRTIHRQTRHSSDG